MNPNHDDKGLFAEGEGSVHDTPHHVEQAKANNEKARDHAAKAVDQAKAGNHGKAKSHIDKAKDHHSRAGAHVSNAHAKAQTAGHQIHAHVAHEHHSLTEVIVEQATERVEQLKEEADKSAV